MRCVTAEPQSKRNSFSFTDLLKLNARLHKQIKNELRKYKTTKFARELQYSSISMYKNQDILSPSLICY